MHRILSLPSLIAVVFICISIISCKKDTGPLYIAPSFVTPVSFRNDIQPIFNASCRSCHNATHPNLQLDSCCSYYELFYTGSNAPYIDTLNPMDSRLIKRMTGVITPVMPMTGALPQSQIDLVVRWIEEGAKNN